MSTLAWRILGVLVRSWQDHVAFLADWLIAEMLDLPHEKFLPHTEEWQAIQELLDKGLIEELPAIHGYSAYRVIVLEEKGK